MTLKEAAQKAQRLRKNLPRQVAKSIQRNRIVTIELVKTQLLSGVDKNSVFLSPTYTQDPFFQNTEAATRYKDRKDELLSSHNSRKLVQDLFKAKPDDVPNLIYSGQFHDKIKMRVIGTEVEFTSTWAKAPRVQAKYPTALGIAEPSFTYLWNTHIKHDLVSYFYGM